MESSSFPSIQPVTNPASQRASEPAVQPPASQPAQPARCYHHASTQQRKGVKLGIEAMLVESSVCENKATSDPLPTYGMNASPPPTFNVGILTDPWQRILRLFSLAQRTQYRLSSTLRLGSGGLMLYEDRLAEWLYFRKHWYHASLHKLTRTLWWWKFRQSDLESV